MMSCPYIGKPYPPICRVTCFGLYGNAPQPYCESMQSAGPQPHSIDRIAASLQASSKRSIVCILTAGSCRLGLCLLLLRLLLCSAAADSTSRPPDCRTRGGASTRIAGNRSANRAGGRTAARPANCLTLRLLCTRGSRRRFTGVESALTYGPLTTFISILVLLLRGLPFRGIYVWATVLCACACDPNTDRECHDDQLEYGATY